MTAPDPAIRIGEELNALLEQTAAHIDRPVSKIFRAAAQRVASGHANAARLDDETILVVYRDTLQGTVVQTEINKMYYRSGKFPLKVRNQARHEMNADEFRAVVAAACLSALAAPPAARFPEPEGSYNVVPNEPEDDTDPDE